MIKCGVYLNKGRIVVLAAFLPMALALLNCERVLIRLNQNPQAAAYA